jgi:hypothetical protein
LNLIIKLFGSGMPLEEGVTLHEMIDINNAPVLEV